MDPVVCYRWQPAAIRKPSTGRTSRGPAPECKGTRREDKMLNGSFCDRHSVHMFSRLVALSVSVHDSSSTPTKERYVVDLRTGVHCLSTHVLCVPPRCLRGWNFKSN